MKTSPSVREEIERIFASGTSEGAAKGWQHRTREGALSHLRSLRAAGFKGKASVEKDDRLGVYFIRKQEGELAERKKPEEITPYDKQIRQMKKFGTGDMHGALADHVYSDKAMRREWEADNAEAVKKGHVSWEDAAGDLAANYLSMYRSAKASEPTLDAIYAKLT